MFSGARRVGPGDSDVESCALQLMAITLACMLRAVARLVPRCLSSSPLLWPYAEQCHSAEYALSCP